MTRLEFWLLCFAAGVIVVIAWQLMIRHLQRQEAKYRRERAERSRKRWGRPS